MTAQTHSPERVLARPMSALLVAAMVLSVLVAVAAPAFASAAGWARLQAGVTVTPGDAKPYSIQVESRDEPINLVVFNVPTGIGLDIVATQAPEGWTGKISQVGTIGERIIFSADDGGSLAPNSRLTFPFTVDVDPPAAAERKGTFDVQLSSDLGRSFTTATTGTSDPLGGGTLTTTIKFLEVTLVEIINNTLAADGTGTEGQLVEVRTTIKNFATVPVTVDPGLSFSGSNEYPSNDVVESDAGTISVPSAGEATAVFEARLGDAVRVENGGRGPRTFRDDRPVTIVGTASETLSSSSALSSGLAYEVERRAELALDGDEFAPTVVAPGPRTFTAPAMRSGTPDVTIDESTIAFAGTTAATQDAVAFPADGEAPQLSFVGQVPEIDGDHEVTQQFELTDGNGYSYCWPLESSAADDDPSDGCGDFSTVIAHDLLGRPGPLEITIDALAPIIDAAISLPNDGDGRRQEAAKNGDSISVSGSIDDANATIDRVQLLANGVVVAETDSVSRSLDRRSYSTSFSGVDFGGSFGTFVAVATASDTAGNVGVGISDLVEFDNIVPALTRARTLSTIDLDDGLGAIGAEAKILVHFDDNGTVKGGCNPNEFSINGQNIVREVQHSDGSFCAPGERGPDNDRLLVLNIPLDRDDTPIVRYTPIPGDRLKDGAGNFAPEAAVTATSGIIPPLPDLVEVYRNTSGVDSTDGCLDGDCEVAYEDEGSYWTRFGGTDPVVCVSGARPGYSIQILDASGIVLNTVASEGSPDCLAVPIGTSDGEFVRGVRFVNAAGPGETLDLSIVLDTVLPTIASHTRDGDEIEVLFDEKVVEGANSSLDWNVFERLENGNLTFYTVDDVATPETFSPSFDGLTVPDYERRILTVDFREHGPYIGIGYEYDSAEFGGARYGDRAGNIMQDEVGPIPPSAQ